MPKITFKQKNSISGQPKEIIASFSIESNDAKKAEKTKSIYIRTGFKNNTIFISQKGKGGNGAGDIISLDLKEDLELEVSYWIYIKLFTWAIKNSLIDQKKG